MADVTAGRLANMPCAAPGLASYRYPSAYGGWVMIGARDDWDALGEAGRSVDGKTFMSKLEKWDAQERKYMPVM